MQVYDGPLRVPEIDDRKYRIVTLANGIDALLISDAATDRASAALDVNVGYSCDPKDVPGLAHFLEHMLFLGTEKYPRENEYSQYLSDVGGGYSNAYTSYENTNFYFEVAAEALEGALDRFSQFFICPLFDESCTDRELSAVDSEHKKNIQDDGWRLHQLEQDLSIDGHIFQRFGTGNLETLKESPRILGVKTRDLCINFYKTHYSANRMKLCILGKESLDEIQTWCAQMFTDIENKNIPKKEPHESPLGVNELGKLIRVKPVKDSQILKIIFPWPDTSDLYRKAVNGYIAHLIGHESEGSILAKLKSLGLASELSCGPEYGGKGFSFFKIEISLSDRGLSEWANVIAKVFQYIKMLQQTGAIEWVYEECSIMANLAFRYQEKSSPSDYCSLLAQNMHEYSKEDILEGSYRMDDFDPRLIQSLLNLLQPKNFRAILISTPESTAGWNISKWYGAEYTVEPLSLEFLERLSKIELDSDFAMPQMNPFIPHNFVTIPGDHNVDVFETPRIIKDNDTTRVWYLLDTIYKVPRTGIVLMMKSPVAYASPRYCVLTALYCDLVSDALNQTSYFAESAGLHYDLSYTVEGLVLSVVGYSDKLVMFLKTILKQMASLVVDSERFIVIKEELTRTYANFDAHNPDEHASYFLTWILQERLWTDAEKLQEIASITSDDVKRFYPEILNPMHIEALIHGTLSRRDALSVITMVETLLVGGNALRSIPQFARANTVRTHCLPEDAALIYRRRLPNADNLNNAVEYYIEFGPFSRSTMAKANLFNQIVSEPCFDILRTKEQLGYVVWCGLRNGTGVVGYTIHVQSEKDPVFVEGRIKSFLLKAREIIEALSESEFARHRETLASKLLEKPKYMMASTQNYWNKITDGTYDFLLLENTANAVLKLKKSEMLDFYDNLIGYRSGAKKLSVQIWSASAVKGAANTVSSCLRNLSETNELVLISERDVSEMRKMWTLSANGFCELGIESFYLFEGNNQ